MKLLCDVCENAVASVVCCADEAALCSSCDSRVHAANKLASKHQRVPLLSNTSEPAMCDICQERPSFFFCVEDRALLCRECDVSIHSVNVLAAKHRRFLLTGIKVGFSSHGSTCQETTSAVTMEQHMPASTPVEDMELGLKKPLKQAMAVATGNCSRDDSGMVSNGDGNKVPSLPREVSKLSSASVPVDAKSKRSYTMTKDGTLSMASNTDHSKASTAINSTTISIQRISAGQRVPFVAPVLSSIRSYLLREEAAHSDTSKNICSNSRNINTDEYSNNNSVMMDVDTASPSGNDSISEYLNSAGIPGWRLDELLTDLVSVCDSGRPLSPPKETNVPGFGLQEEQSWFAELDFLEEHELSPSQKESVALVPEMPSPPTHSGLVTTRGKATCPAAQSWAFDYLFTGPDHPNEFSVVPDIGGRRSSPASPDSPTRDKVNKKRKYWLNA